MPNDFFPQPDNHCVPTPVEIPLGYVQRVMTCEDARVAFCVGVHEGEEKSLYRFVLPDHTRVVRRFFREAGVTPNRRREVFDVERGGFFIGFEGTVIGTDVIPEGFALKAVYVLDQVTVSRMP